MGQTNHILTYQQTLKRLNIQAEDRRKAGMLSAIKPFYIGIDDIRLQYLTYELMVMV